VLLFAITVHEASHGWAAYKMGDPTAHNLGRVTLNPLAHIDPIGTVLLPVMLSLVGFPAFGWAKPVPVNPHNLQNPRWGKSAWFPTTCPEFSFLPVALSYAINTAGFTMNVLMIVMQLFIVLFAITIHEASHGWAANKMGDPTAHNLGRVTLNPIAHIDPVGTIMLPVLLSLVGLPAFGWAKPVPVNPYNLRNPRRDNLWISFAGPASNLIAAATAFILLFIMKLVSTRAAEFLRDLVISLKMQRGFLVPFPLGGFHPAESAALFLFMLLIMNCYFAIFNLIPIPPLDGSGILMGLLSDEWAQKFDRLRPFGFIIVIFLVYMGFLSFIIEPLKFLFFIFLG